MIKLMAIVSAPVTFLRHIPEAYQGFRTWRFQSREQELKREIQKIEEDFAFLGTWQGIDSWRISHGNKLARLKAELETLQNQYFLPNKMN